MKSKLFDFGKIVEGAYYPGTFLIGPYKREGNDFSMSVQFSKPEWKRF